MTLNILGKGNVFSDIVNIIVMPFQRFANILKDSFMGFTEYFTEFNNLKEKNAELERKVALLESELEDTRVLKQTNAMYEAFYKIKKEHMDFELQPAAIIAREYENFISVLTINRGSFHGIEKDMPVIGTDNAGNNGIVGYISETGVMTSKVVLFIRTGVSIGAYIKSSGQTGVVEGDFELEQEGLCRLTFLTKETELIEGDKIYSSGYGGIFPEGLQIGEIIRIEPDAKSQSFTGIIKPAIDLSVIRSIMIITKFERKFYYEDANG